MSLDKHFGLKLLDNSKLAVVYISGWDQNIKLLIRNFLANRDISPKVERQKSQKNCSWQL